MEKNKRQPQPRSSSIESRLMILIVLLVVVPLIITISVSIFLGMNSSRDQVIRQLQSVATLKDNELQSWVEDLHTNLTGLLFEPANIPLWEQVVGPQSQPQTPAYQQATRQIQQQFDIVLGNTHLFEEVFLMDAKGIVVVTTDSSQQGLNKSSRAFFSKGSSSFYINPPYNDPDVGKLIMVAALPVVTPDNQMVGVLAGRINMKKLSDLMLIREGLGQTGQTYLVQQSHALLTESRFPGWDFGKFVFSQGINLAVEKKSQGYGSYLDYRGVPVLGVFRWLPDLQMVLLAEQDQAEALRTTYTTLVTNSIAAALALAVAILAAVIATRRITKPIGELSSTAKRIAGGNLEISATVKQHDEIGALAVSFNSMTSQLRSLIGDLEQRVADRTREVERRSVQLQVAADIARDATSVRDLQELLNNAVNQIRDRFGFYHAGIFLVDEHREFAVLRAATGEAGQTMLEQEHKLKIGQEGIVGYVTGTGQPRIALDVGVDAIYFKNPILPETRSEMALPLKTGNRIIGALDVQSQVEAAFDKEDVRVLQTMADQLAVAIENARLFQEMEETLQQLEVSQSQFTRAAWQKFIQSKGRAVGYRLRGLGIEPIQEQSYEAGQVLREGKSLIRKEAPQGSSLLVPIKMRGEVLGAMHIRFDRDILPEETVKTYEEIATRLSLALENARLLEETQLRSEQLNLLQEITATAASQINAQDLLEEVTQRLLTGFDLQHCGAFLFDPNLNSCKRVADVSRKPGLPGADMRGMRFELNQIKALQKVIHTQKTIVFYDAQNNPDTSLFQDMMKKRGSHTLILIPLQLRGEIIGAIAMETDDRRRLISDEDQQLLDQIGLQVSVGMDVARLFEQTEQKVERERLISEITTKVRASTNVDIILQTSVKELTQALGIPYGAIQLKGGNGGGSDE
jgi:GAF domain-containing protein/HAMP domain-containing protein